MLSKCPGLRVVKMYCRKAIEFLGRAQGIMPAIVRLLVASTSTASTSDDTTAAAAAAANY